METYFEFQDHSAALSENEDALVKSRKRQSRLRLLAVILLVAVMLSIMIFTSL